MIVVLLKVQSTKPEKTVYEIVNFWKTVRPRKLQRALGQTFNGDQ